MSVSVCLSARLLKKLWMDFDEICGGVGRGPRNSRLAFWWLSGSHSDSGFFLQYSWFFNIPCCDSYKLPRIKLENLPQSFELSRCFLVFSIFLTASETVLTEEKLPRRKQCLGRNRHFRKEVPPICNDVITRTTRYKNKAKAASCKAKTKDALCGQGQNFRLKAKAIAEA